MFLVDTLLSGFHSMLIFNRGVLGLLDIVSTTRQSFFSYLRGEVTPMYRFNGVLYLSIVRLTPMAMSTLVFDPISPFAYICPLILDSNFSFVQKTWVQEVYFS